MKAKKFNELLTTLLKTKKPNMKQQTQNRTTEPVELIMSVQFIYTFEEREQIITHYRPLYKDFLTNKNIFLSYAMHNLDNDDERGELIKISCCLLDCPKKQIPDWYFECKGKFWLDDLHTWRKENKVQSLVSKDYLKKWMAENV